MTIQFTLSDLSVGWGTDVQLSVKHLTYAGVQTGNKLAITGATGMGKSTLMYTLAGLKSPLSGICRWKLPGSEYNLTPKFKDTSAVKLEYLHKRQFGFMFQNSRMLPLLSIKDSLRYTLRFTGMERSLIDSEVKKVLDQMSINGDLLKNADFYPQQLSGGQQQRAALAHAIIHDPDVLFADEPTASLDEHARAETMKVIDRWLNHRKDKLFIWVTHHEAEYKSNVSLHITVNDTGEKVLNLHRPDHRRVNA